MTHTQELLCSYCYGIGCSVAPATPYTPILAFPLEGEGTLLARARTNNLSFEYAE